MSERSDGLLAEVGVFLSFHAVCFGIIVGRRVSGVVRAWVTWVGGVVSIGDMTWAGGVVTVERGGCCVRRGGGSLGCIVVSLGRNNAGGVGLGSSVGWLRWSGNK